MAFITPNNNLLSSLNSLLGGSRPQDQSAASTQQVSQSTTEAANSRTRESGDQDPRRQAMIDEFRARRAQRRSVANPLSTAGELRAASDRVRDLGDSVLAREAPGTAGAAGAGRRHALGQIVDIFV